MSPIPSLTRGRVVAIGALGLIVAAVVLLGIGRASATKSDVTSPLLKACSAGTSLFNAGPEVAGLEFNHVRRVCSEPEPTVSASAGGGIDPESLHRSNFTSFVYGDCTPAGEFGCPYPLEIQVWPTCERNPSKYAAASAAPAGDLGPDELGGPELLDETVIRNVPVYVYGNAGDRASVAETAPERVETVVGDSTVVVFSDGSAGRGPELNRMLNAIRELRPAGDSNAPSTRAVPAATISKTPLPAPVRAASNGTLVCNS